jgi:hypothetical protein
MANATGQQTHSILEDVLVRRTDIRVEDWRALVEDTLRHFLPNDSRLLGRLNDLAHEEPTQIEEAYKSVIRAACEELKAITTEPQPAINQEQIELAITRGYFKSWPFRLVVGGILVLFTLIGGVASFKIKDQVDAMQRHLDEARRQVETGREQVTKAQVEIGTMKAGLNAQVLQSSTELLTTREKAIADLQQAERGYQNELEERKKELSSDLDNVEKRSKSELTDKTNRLNDEMDEVQGQNKTQLASKVQSAIRNLEAAKSPWIPMVAWVTTKWWLIFIFTVTLSISAWLMSANGLWQGNGLRTKIPVILNALVVLGVAVLLLKMR